MNRLKVIVKNGDIDSLGNYAGAKDIFPTIEVDQVSSTVTVTYFEVSNSKRGQWGKTHEHDERKSSDGQAVLITGMCGLRNDRRRTGGRQSFCYGVFRGDSGHIYVHRAPATKRWMECLPGLLLARLRKVGCGATIGVIQQGDFLLKPANGKAVDVDVFKHEWSGAGHHTFTEPVLSEYVDGVGRLVLVQEGHDVKVVHKAVDGIQHPTMTVPAGQWIVGTTAASLRHSNKRD
jgi:hypothetical protein